jgi:hypothetical protein
MKTLGTIGCTTTFNRCFNYPLQPFHTFSGVRLRFDAFIVPWRKLEHNFYLFLWLAILGVIVLELDNLVRKGIIKDQRTHLSLSAPAFPYRVWCDLLQPGNIYIAIRE